MTKMVSLTASNLLLVTILAIISHSAFGGITIKIRSTMQKDQNYFYYKIAINCNKKPYASIDCEAIVGEVNAFYVDDSELYETVGGSEDDDDGEDVAKCESQEYKIVVQSFRRSDNQYMKKREFVKTIGDDGTYEIDFDKPKKRKSFGRSK